MSKCRDLPDGDPAAVQEYWTENYQPFRFNSPSLPMLKIDAGTANLRKIGLRYFDVRGTFETTYAVTGNRMRVVLVDEGEVELIVNGRVYALGPHAGLFAMAGDEMTCRGDRLAFFSLSMSVGSPALARLASVPWIDRKGVARDLDRRTASSLRNLLQCIALETDARQNHVLDLPYMLALEQSVCELMIDFISTRIPGLVRAVDFGAAEVYRRAVEYIEANLLGALDIATVASAIGANERSLERTVKELSGLTFVNLVKLRHLEFARTLLVHSDAENSVGAVARRAQYTNLGRFADHYAREYGELPSDTLARRKARRRNEGRTGA